MQASESEPATHSFIIRIWSEGMDEDTGRVTWRGHITHVADDQRRYVQTLEDITRFIAPYVRAMGAEAEDKG